MQRLAASGAALSPELQDLVEMYGICNKGATTALTQELPRPTASSRSTSMPA